MVWTSAELSLVEESQVLFSEKNKNNITDLLSAKLTLNMFRRTPFGVQIISFHDEFWENAGKFIKLKPNPIPLHLPSQPTPLSKFETPV